MTVTFASQTVQSTVLAHYWDALAAGLRTLADERAPSGAFDPGVDLPELDDSMIAFLEPISMRVADLKVDGSARVRLLDLMTNPRTRTTKSLASTLMIARANHRHVERRR